MHKAAFGDNIYHRLNCDMILHQLECPHADTQNICQMFPKSFQEDETDPIYLFKTNIL